MLTVTARAHRRGLWVLVDAPEDLEFTAEYLALGAGGQRRDGEVLGLTTRGVTSRFVPLPFAPVFAAILRFDLHLPQTTTRSGSPQRGGFGGERTRWVAGPLRSSFEAPFFETADIRFLSPEPMSARPYVEAYDEATYPYAQYWSTEAYGLPYDGVTAEWPTPYDVSAPYAPIPDE